MLHGLDLLRQQYLKYATPGAQSPEGTVQVLAAKLEDTSLTIDDHNAAIVSLKSLVRDHASVVTDHALPHLLRWIQRGANDEDAMRSAVECVLGLCQLPQDADSTHRVNALRSMEQVIGQPGALLMLLGLLDPRRGFYTRFAALQLLSTLVEHRGHDVQEHVLVAPGGCGAVLQCLDAAPNSSTEIIRNEALLLLPHLVSGSPDIQKLIAFEGAFERLLDIIAQEGRIEGGIIAQDALESLDALLLYNVSNQNYFRETLSIPLLAPLLFYPPPLAHNAPEAAQQEYAAHRNAFLLQEWDEQKLVNALVLFRVVRRLVDGQGDGHRANQLALRHSGFTECTAQLALASLAPPLLKAHALSLLSLLVRDSRLNQDLVSQLVITPVALIPGDSVDGVPAPAQLTWQPPQSAVLALITLALRGLGGISQRELALAVRLSALDTIENLVGQNVDIRMLVLEALVAAPSADLPGQNRLLLDVLTRLPDGLNASVSFDPYQHVIATMILAALLRGSETAKEFVHRITVGADGQCTIAPQESTEDEPTLLIQQVIGSVAMAFRSLAEAVRRERAGETDTGNSATDWTRVITAYLSLLAEWLWHSPLSVGDLLAESANAHVLVQPAAQSLGVDPVVQSLAVFVLGTAYEFDMLDEAEGVLSRSALHSILHSRIGPDQFGVRLLRIKSDARFSDVEPDFLDNLLRAAATASPEAGADSQERVMWFSWPFVEFWKENYVRVQKSILIDPSATSASKSGIPAELLDARQQVTSLQGELAAAEKDARRANMEIDELRSQINALLAEKEVSSTDQPEIAALRENIAALEQERSQFSERLAAAENGRKALESHINSLETERNTLSGRIVQLEHEHDHHMRHSSTEVESLRAKNASLESTVSKLKSENASLHQHASAHAELESLRSQLAQAQSRAADLERQLGSVDNSEVETLRTENEDLLVLLDDISTKRKEDKAKMRAHGWEVSDDDDDDDNDDIDE
ncbi:type I protein arginine methyltransferase [Malassezia cuniculi]|uniref:Type I protein arginine methyltransferase n=1 Tax=Malassezia cuniculi TaxID=948313 RepID=A0AAF0J6T8_9BASI|nr:type I protein arginine methyltransferase [Malassezia cuniculi]